jgi:hypothetical protein
MFIPLQTWTVVRCRVGVEPNIELRWRHKLVVADPDVASVCM